MNYLLYCIGDGYIYRDQGTLTLMGWQPNYIYMDIIGTHTLTLISIKNAT